MDIVKMLDCSELAVEGFRLQFHRDLGSFPIEGQSPEQRSYMMSVNRCRGIDDCSPEA